jgi:translation elongation factor EF-Tu-like GTPase
VFRLVVQDVFAIKRRGVVATGVVVTAAAVY